LLPLVIWYRYSEEVVSNGGLYTFVQAAVGKPLALTQAAFWIVSYFLYLVYTVPFIVYDLLPGIAPEMAPYRLAIDVVLVFAVGGLMLLPLIAGVTTLAAIGLLQSILAVMLIAGSYLHFGASTDALIGHGNFGSILRSSGQTASLYICGSLPLFLGGEVRGGGRTVRRSLAWAFAAVGGLVLLAAIPLARFGPSMLGADIPGLQAANQAAGASAGIIVGVGICLSVAGLILAEFLALTRLLATISEKSQRTVVIAAVSAFLLGSLIALVNPERAYDLLLKPSLIALWISQLLVVAVYPIFAARRGRLKLADLGFASGASALMAFGLFSALTSSAST
jgi:hypothetical protein